MAEQTGWRGGVGHPAVAVAVVCPPRHKIDLACINASFQLDAEDATAITEEAERFCDACPVSVFVFKMPRYEAPVQEEEEEAQAYTGLLRRMTTRHFKPGEVAGMGKGSPAGNRRTSATSIREEVDDNAKLTKLRSVSHYSGAVGSGGTMNKAASRIDRTLSRR